MLLQESKFIVQKVGEVQKTKDEKHEFKSIVLLRPGFTDEFGEKKGFDDIWMQEAGIKTLRTYQH